MTEPGPGGWRRIAISHAGQLLEGWWRFVGQRVHLESAYGSATAFPNEAPLDVVARDLLVAAASLRPVGRVEGEPEQDSGE